MERNARLFNCLGCHHRVTLCSGCDRGQVYCRSKCAQLARRATVRAAGRRYQATFKGRQKHAVRQKRYRQKKQKVTHQGSPVLPPNDVMQTVLVPENKPVISGHSEGITCHFCGEKCDPFVRVDFLVTPLTRSSFLTQAWSHGP